MTCPNCGLDPQGTPCSVCGYTRRRPSVYPIAHDALTDSYQLRPPGRGRIRPASRPDRQDDRRVA
jgi:hypothetical protein